MKKKIPQKFLLIQFRQIGDVILTTPIPKILRRHFPHAQIDVLTFSVNERIWRYNPHISNLIPFNKKRGFLAFLKLLRQIRRSHYDAVLDFQNTPRSTYCSLVSFAGYRVTWENSSRRRAYNTLVPSRPIYPAAAKCSFLTPFIEELNVTEMPAPRPEVHFSKIEERRVDAIFQKYRIQPEDMVVTLAPTHRRIVRRWPLEFFLEAAHFIIKKYNAKVILSWGPGEETYIKKGISEGDYEHPHLISDLFLNLLELAALMKRSTFHLGNDSAPQHLAVTQHLPTFTIFGATSTTWVYPSDEHVWIQKKLECQPCNKLECRFGDALPCLKTLEFEHIRPQLEEFIKTIDLKR